MQSSNVHNWYTKPGWYKVNQPVPEFAGETPEEFGMIIWSNGIDEFLGEKEGMYNGDYWYYRNLPEDDDAL